MLAIPIPPMPSLIADEKEEFLRWGIGEYDITGKCTLIYTPVNLFLGHFYLGSSLLELDKIDESIKHLQTAFELAKKGKYVSV